MEKGPYSPWFSQDDTHQQVLYMIMPITPNICYTCNRYPTVGTFIHEHKDNMSFNWVSRCHWSQNYLHPLTGWYLMLPYRILSTYSQVEIVTQIHEWMLPSRYPWQWEFLHIYGIHVTCIYYWGIYINGTSWAAIMVPIHAYTYRWD